MILSFDIFREISQTHIAFAADRIVHGEGCRQVMVSLSALGYFQVVPKQLLVVGMYAILDDALCSLHRALAAQICHTLLGGDDVDIVL